MIESWAGVLRLAAVLLALFQLSLHADQAAASDAALHITTARTLSIASQGFSPPPYQSDDEAAQGAWETVRLPHLLTRRQNPPMVRANAVGTPTVITWYRVQAPPPTPSDRYAGGNYLYIPRWKTDGQLAVYGDGRLLYQSHASVQWNGTNIPLWIALDDSASAVSPRDIVLRIVRPRDSEGAMSSVWVGPERALNWRYRLRHLLQVDLPYMSSAAFMAAGLFSLVALFRSRRDTIFLLFFCMSVASFVRTLHSYVGEQRLPISDECFTWLTVNSLYWMLLVTHFLFNQIHGRPVAWLNRVVVGMTVAVGIMTLPVFKAQVDAYALSPLAYLALLALGAVVGSVGVHQSRRRWSPDSLLLSAWTFMGMVLGGHDWLLQNNRVDIERIYLGPYTNICGFLIFVHIIFRRYLKDQEQIRQADMKLHERLQEREAELLLSHERLRDIEHRQTLSNERQRLMQDMHDGIGSSLLTALLAVERGRVDTAMVADVLKGCIDDLKLTIDSIEPIQADLLLLLATLRFRLGPRLESAGIVLRWRVENVPTLAWIDPRNALHILRILQEAFTNIIKHTRATEISVATRVEGDTVLVVITDNGQGFSVESGIRGPGKGLGNQISRAASIGAEIRWNSSAAGTCLTLRLPVQRSAA